MASDPQPLASLSLTQVHYVYPQAFPISNTTLTHNQNPADHLSHLSAWLALVPQSLLLTYAILIYTTREIELILLLGGQLACEALNFVLKRIIKEERPQLIRELGKGYGMPSSHAQFVSFWAVYVVLFLWIRLRPSGHGRMGGGYGYGTKGHSRRVSGGVLKNGPASPAGTALAKAKENGHGIDTIPEQATDLDSDADLSQSPISSSILPSTIYALQLRYHAFKNLILSVAVLVLGAAVAYSRVYLSYHTPRQVLAGLLAGTIFGVLYFGFTAYLRSSGWIDWALELEIVRMARMRDLVCEEDLVELSWIVWEEKRREKARRLAGRSGRRKTVRLIDPKTGNGAPPAEGSEAAKKKQK